MPRTRTKLELDWTHFAEQDHHRVKELYTANFPEHLEERRHLDPTRILLLFGIAAIASAREAAGFLNEAKDFEVNRSELLDFIPLHLGKIPVETDPPSAHQKYRYFAAVLLTAQPELANFPTNSLFKEIVAYAGDLRDLAEQAHFQLHPGYSFHLPKLPKFYTANNTNR